MRGRHAERAIAKAFGPGQDFDAGDFHVGDRPLPGRSDIGSWRPRDCARADRRPVAPFLSAIQDAGRRCADFRAFVRDMSQLRVEGNSGLDPAIEGA